MTVDKLYSPLRDPDAQNLRVTRPPIPSSGSLTSTVPILELSMDSATRVTTTYKKGKDMYIQLIAHGCNNVIEQNTYKSTYMAPRYSSTSSTQFGRPHNKQ